MNKTVILAALLAAALTACPMTTPAPTTSSVILAGPSAPALKIGATATFAASAKDSSGTVLTRSFTWASSDPSIASVDANGIVTAKRLGDVKITASTDGKSGEARLKTYGLEAVGGTYTPNTGTLGTALSFKVRGPDGNLPGVGTPFTITGPSTWRPGKPPVQLKYYDAGSWGLNWWGLYQSTPISGIYQASITVGTETLTASFQIDASKTVSVASSFTVSVASAAGATVTWTKPAGAYNFAVAIEDSTAGLSLAEQRPKGDTATFGGLSLNAAHTNLMEVFLSSVDVSGDDPVFPAQLDLSIFFQSFTF
jgi:Bacterial Ig-like domain (group 2)